MHVVGSPAHSEKVLQWVSAVMAHGLGSLPNAAESQLCAGCLVFVKEITSRLGRWVWWDLFALLYILLVLSSLLCCFSHPVSVKTWPAGHDVPNPVFWGFSCSESEWRRKCTQCTL